MAEEINNTESESPAPVEYNQTEQLALESGWVPKEEYNGDEHKWVDAGEFLRRGELFKKIESQSRELKDVKKALVEFRSLHGKVREVEYQRAIDALKAQKKVALEEGDADAVIDVDERLDLVKQEQRNLKQTAHEPEAEEAHPDFVQWTEKNSWYTANKPMKAFADALGVELAEQGLTPPQVLKKVEEEVRKEFPSKFRNANRDKPGSVEGTSSRGGGRESFQLSDEERRIMHTFVKTGALSEKEYIESLKKVKGL